MQGIVCVYDALRQPVYVSRANYHHAPLWHQTSPSLQMILADKRAGFPATTPPVYQTRTAIVSQGLGLPTHSEASSCFLSDLTGTHHVRRRFNKLLP